MHGELIKVKELSPFGKIDREVISDSTQVRAPLWKRCLDISLLLMASPTVLPLMLLISAFIKLASPGPVFFRQERVGFMGRRFFCLKFRSMKVNADTKLHQDHLKDLM